MITRSRPSIRLRNDAQQLHEKLGSNIRPPGEEAGRCCHALILPLGVVVGAGCRVSMSAPVAREVRGECLVALPRRLLSRDRI